MSYLGINDDAIKNLMLNKINIENIEDLFSDIPESIRLNRNLNLEDAYNEWQLESYFEKLATKNNITINFKGAGVYHHHVPALVNAIISRGEFLTAYTPYQPEVSQGTLEAIYLFQSYMAELTGMEISNASMYDGATALAESLIMSWRLNSNRKIYLSKFIHPEYIAVAKNYLDAQNIQYKFYDSFADIEDGSTVVIQNPNFYGDLMNQETFGILQELIKKHNLFLILVIPEIYSLLVQNSAAELGASIVCGSAQSFGNNIYYGGAQIGFISSKLEYIRQMPGRIAGKTKDRSGQEAYVLTFQAREQHIKRERASSNICTNQALHALAVTVYMRLLGASGLRNVAKKIWARTEALKQALGQITNLEIKTQEQFNEFTIGIFQQETKLSKLLNQKTVNINRILKNNSSLFSIDFTKQLFLITVSETHEIDVLNDFILQILEALDIKPNPQYFISLEQLESLEQRFVSHSSYHSEEFSELDTCRFFTRLSQKNFSIDTHFYPLGSCTMKYNPKINDLIASNSVWRNIHPYSEDDDAQGVLEVYQELNQALCEITGFSRFSLETAAGAHGEYAALLMAKSYFQSKQENRNIVLVPDSAHGTNPASASMAGFKTITIKSLTNGDIDLNDLQSVIASHHRNIAVFMMTNPSTMGLFTTNILEVVDLVHQDGALMYYDGANLNAIMGIVRPGDMGFDLIHLNLHKSFSTPHGGGGPGAGPVGASEALAPYLPGPQISRENQKYFWDYSEYKSIGKLRAFHGNFNVLIRALAYIKTNGYKGLKAISEIAVLNANYLQSQILSNPKLQILNPQFNRLCKHEFVLSAQKLKDQYEITAFDIAKRLIDKGFHPPTIYFPLTIPEAIMIEPTETESLGTLDAFIDALESIINEATTEEGRNLIKQAPLSTKYSRFDDVNAVKNPILCRCME